MQAENIELKENGFVFSLSHAEKDKKIETKLLGSFNIDNLLAAMSILFTLGYDLNKIIAQTKYLEAAPGRMQFYSAQQNYLPVAVVDYAHTPDALKKALSALRKHCRGPFALCLWVRRR